jgi:hypothetical protein
MQDLYALPVQTDKSQSSSVSAAQTRLGDSSEPPNKVLLSRMPQLPAYATHFSSLPAQNSTHFSAPVATIAAQTNAPQPVAIVPLRAVGTPTGNLPVPTDAPMVLDPSVPSISPQMLVEAAVGHTERVAAKIAATEVKASQATAAAQAAVSQARASEAAATQQAADVRATANAAVNAARESAQKATQGVHIMQDTVNAQQATIQAANERMRLQELDRVRLSEAADAERLQRIHDKEAQDNEMRRAQDAMDNTVNTLARELQARISASDQDANSKQKVLEDHCRNFSITNAGCRQE